MKRRKKFMKYFYIIYILNIRLVIYKKIEIIFKEKNINLNFFDVS